MAVSPSDDQPVSWLTTSSLLANYPLPSCLEHIFTTYGPIHRQTNTWTVQSQTGQLMD